MARPVGTFVLGVAILAGLSCGRKGALQLPAGREPMAVEVVTAFQRGERIILEWMNPDRAVSGRPTAVAAVEIRALEEARGEDMDRRAAPLVRIEQDEFPRYRPGSASGDLKMSYEHPFDGRRAGTMRLSFSIRVFDGRGRASDFCPPVAVETRACPKPPRMGGIRVFPELIEVVWARPEGNIDGTVPASLGGYAVYRAEDGGRQEKQTPVPVVTEMFEDRDFRFGASYSYTVRALAPDGGRGVESEDSEAATVTPRDIFPPAPPAGPVAVPGTEGISLSWEPGPERDVAGYRVWRKEPGEADFISLTVGLVREAAFTDRSARKGRTYIYAVSACDLAGNESSKSESGPLALKGNRP